MYLFLPHDERMSEYHARGQRWAEPLGAALGEAYASEPFPRVARYQSRWTTPSAADFACEELEVPGLTLETPYSVARSTLLTVEAYREAGARLATAVAEQAQAEAGARRGL